MSSSTSMRFPPPATAAHPVSSDIAPVHAGCDGELDSEALLGGQRRRVIVHQGERYCLQITRAGKLLLTK